MINPFASSSIGCKRKHRSKPLLVLLCLCLSLITGCEPTEEPPAAPVEVLPPLVIGLIPEQNIFKQLERYEPLAAYLSERLERRIQLKILTRYGNIIENFNDLGLDGAFFGSFTYALAHRRLGVEVLARPEALDGTSTYYGMLFVRKDSGIRTARDMKGKRFAFVDRATTAGYLLPLAYFKENRIQEYTSFLGEAYFTGTHEDAIYDVLEGRADVGAAKNTVFDRLARRDPRLGKELIILARSPEVPENGLALRRDLDLSLKRRIKQTLLQMTEDAEGRRVLQEFGARRFIETTDLDYKPVFDFAEETGLDLASYDYMNE